MLVPGSYAQDNIHLGYASTIHRAQGATVETTHAVVDTSVDRAGLYVAMTRGKQENRAYAVCEPVVDFVAEDAHMHSAGDRDAPTASEVLATILRRDTHQASATAALREEMDHATDPARLEALYRHGVDLAADAFTSATLAEYTDALPRLYSRQLEADPDQYAAIAQAWTDAAKAGRDPREHWTQATANLETADSPGAVIAHRLRHVTAAGQDRSALPTPPPATATGDAELAAWLTATHDELTTSPDEDTAQAPSVDVDDFTASYLDHRAAEEESGPDTHSTTGSPWGPTTDSSPDLW
ncbi:helicase C-terminal domain-containing protein [Dietzia sp. SLG310A2-38A2]|jgi:hypothetical protein|nr:helicase C-terminal domain-containing protein [Dietzia sp. SLG310A2-38A2]